MELYSKSDMIRYYRKKAGLTQEQLSEGICSTETLNRYENKTLVPSDFKYEQIMKRLGIDDTVIKFDIQASIVGFHKIKYVVRNLFEQGNFKKLRNVISQIKERQYLSMLYIENQQFVERIENIIQYQSGNITINAYISNLEELLKLSFPEYSSKDYEAKKVYSENEYLIINNIATAYGKNENVNIASNLFSKTSKILLETYYQECNAEYLLLVNYANFLGIQKRYDESIELCQKAIIWLKYNGKANYLYNFYYDIGWNMIEKAKITKNLKYVASGKVYVWEAYQLCMIYKENKIATEMIAEYFQDIDKIFPPPKSE